MKVDTRRPSTEPNGQSAPEANCPQLALRLREAARVLGISPRHLWELAKRGAVPCFSIGSGRRRLLLFPVAQLKDWLARQVGPAREPHDG
jgi:predicted DNA-binding transcriptional regulator AlpA